MFQEKKKNQTFLRKLPAETLLAAGFLAALILGEEDITETIVFVRLWNQLVAKEFVQQTRANVTDRVDVDVSTVQNSSGPAMSAWISTPSLRGHKWLHALWKWHITPLEGTLAV
jgi:hypothetical protein